MTFRYDPARAWQPDKDIEQIRKEQQRENTRINRDKMWQLKQQPCADCLLRWHPNCMTFDHIDRRAAFKNKNAKNINSVVYYKPEMFARLLKGTSVVCLNCHRLRELRRDIDGPMWNGAYKDDMIAYLGRCSSGALIDNPDLLKAGDTDANQ